MKTLTKEELESILAKHRAWLQGSHEGCRADLRNADLSGADLSGAVLRNADLRSADLRSADLRSADLRNADLSGADLRSADLSGAVLRNAVLRNADLSGAVLRNADLRSADLSGAVLRNAVLSAIKEDYLLKLAMQKDEVVELYKAILDGKIDGSQYEGECACFVGTIAKIKGVKYCNLTVTPDGGSPTERFFLGIRKGDSPDNNQISSVIAGWTEEFMVENEILIPIRTIKWSQP